MCISDRLLLFEIQRIVAVNDGFIQSDLNLFKDFVKTKILFEEIDGLLHDVLVLGWSFKIADQKNGFVFKFCEFFECKNSQILFIQVSPFIH